MDYSLAVKTARMEAVRDSIDAGDGPGVLEIGTAGMATVLVTIPLNEPSGTVTGDTLNFDASGLTANAIAGAPTQAAEARIRDGDNNDVVIGLSVGMPPPPETPPAERPDVELINTSIAEGQPVTISSAKITHFTAP